MKELVDQRIERVAISIADIVTRLLDLNFTFYHPDRVLRNPDPNLKQYLARIERDVGRVPYAIARFWERIGAVDLTGRHEEWRGCEYPDGLVVLPISEAIDELDQFAADKQQRLASGLPYLIPIAADALCKENVSGGMWYNVNCPANSDDPVVNEEPHNISFLNYLDLAIRWGGFPGLENAKHHTWPIDKLTSDMNE